MKNLSYNIEVNGKQYSLNDKHQLSNVDAWDADILNWLAEKAEVRLQAEHHSALEFIRETYKSRERNPVVRLVAAHLAKKYGPDKGTPKYFYSLFPKGVQQASVLAGIPVKELCF